MTTVVVTGGGQRLDDVVAAVEAAGAEVVRVEDPATLGDAVAGRSVDGYVQLPVSITPSEGSLVARVERFLTEGLLSRFRAAAAVLPSLAAGARIVLVSGQTAVDADAPDDREARVALMRVLAHALRAERAPERLTVRTADRSWTPEQIAADVVGSAARSASPQQTLASSEDAIGQAYADWRAEVMGLVRVEF